jgi:hypothetical protein
MDHTKIKNLIFITILDLWWIALWGIAYILVDFLSNKNKKLELLIYIFLMIFVIVFLMLDAEPLSTARLGL